MFVRETTPNLYFCNIICHFWVLNIMINWNKYVLFIVTIIKFGVPYYLRIITAYSIYNIFHAFIYFICNVSFCFIWILIWYQWSLVLERFFYCFFKLNYLIQKCKLSNKYSPKNIVKILMTVDFYCIVSFPIFNDNKWYNNYSVFFQMVFSLFFAMTIKSTQILADINNT